MTNNSSVLGSTILYAVSDGIARITLNRPDAANAINPDQRNALIDLFLEAERDRAVRVVVIAANGRHFCSGADVGGMGDVQYAGEGVQRLLRGASQLITSVLDCAKPVIAAVQGAAAGMGAHLAFASDLVVASENATFIEAFVGLGMIVDACGAYLLPRRVGLQKAKELIFFGDKLPAREAEALGLVNKVVPADEFPAAVEAYARRLAAAPTTAISFSKRLLNLSLDGDRASALLEEAMAQEIVRRTDDVTEGITAFKERRPPKFQGH